MELDDMDQIFSIILPTYNRAYILWKAIESILSQTEPRWELIVVDDGSTDCTLRMMEEFKDPRIRVLSTPNRGPSSARNHGLSAAQSPYIAYLDSDNTWHPDCLETMRCAIEEDEESVLWYCGQHSTFWERTSDGRWLKIDEITETRQQYSLSDVWNLKAADVSCIVHKREIIEDVGGWDEDCRWLEDWDFFLRVVLRYPDGARWVPHVLVEYRQVFGDGADGICAEARQDKHAEVAARRYLLEKWKDYEGFAAREKLCIGADDLDIPRAKLKSALDIEREVRRER